MEWRKKYSVGADSDPRLRGRIGASAINELIKIKIRLIIEQ
jgi:hypothetical protein